MRAEAYTDFFTGELLMGPNSIYLLDELMEKYPLDQTDTILDLGCGKGLTSLFLARQTPAKICACDLWISAEENQKRFAAWGIDHRVTPTQQDALQLPFENETFDAIVSVDAYHYFAGEPSFFQKKILPLAKREGTVLIAIPGIKAEYEGRQDALLGPWLGEEAFLFRSGEQWKKLIGTSDQIKTVEVWEMQNFSQAWETWLSSNNQHAAGDLAQFETVIRPYTCFIGIAVVKR